MLDSIRKFLFGDPPPHPTAGIPRESRDAHHRLMNTAMKMKRVSGEIDAHVNDILEVLAQDIRRQHEGEEKP